MGWVFTCSTITNSEEDITSLLMMILVREEFLSLSVWHCDTLNRSFVVFLSFLRNISTGPFTFSLFISLFILGTEILLTVLLGCSCLFWGTYQRAFLYFSLSLSLFSLQVDSVCWCKWNTVGWVFNKVFITKGKGEGSTIQGRAGDLVKIWVKLKRWQNNRSITTLAQNKRRMTLGERMGATEWMEPL